MPLPLPDPFVGGPIADSDPRETLTERFAGTQRNFDAIARLMIDTGGRSVKLRFGTHVFSVTTNNSASASVTHGMGSTPLIVVATTDELDWFASADVLGATTFTLKVREYQGTNVTASVATYWIAIG